MDFKGDEQVTSPVTDMLNALFDEKRRLDAMVETRVRKLVAEQQVQIDNLARVSNKDATG